MPTGPSRRGLPFLLACCAALLVGCPKLDPPRWSPDGRQVAFAHYTAGAPPELWLLKLDQAQGMSLLSKAAHTPRWTADGKALYCLIGPDKKSAIYRIGFEGPEPSRRLFMQLQGGSIEGLEMTPDGQIIHFSGLMSLLKAINTTTPYFGEYIGPVNLSQEIVDPVRARFRPPGDRRRGPLPGASGVARVRCGASAGLRHENHRRS